MLKNDKDDDEDSRIWVKMTESRDGGSRYE